MIPHHHGDADRQTSPLLHLLGIAAAPPTDRPPAWLSDRERAVFVGLRVDKRRGDWLAGRRVGKGAVVAALAEWGLAAEGVPPRDRGGNLPASLQFTCSTRALTTAVHRPPEPA